MPALPDIPALVKRTRALAALDLILCPEWEYRYYSFDAKWGSGEMMASMRNGSGDEWWMVFHRDGWAALKGLAHEAPAWAEGGETLSKAIAEALPPALSVFSKEPAFCWDATGFAYYRLPADPGWTRANDATPFPELDAGEDRLLRHLVAPPEAYRDFAVGYYEREVPIDPVRRIFDLAPISKRTVADLNPDVSLKEIQRELYKEIVYPK